MANFIPLIVCQVIWNERNGRAFDNAKHSTNRLKNRCIYYFKSILLGYDIISNVNFVNVTEMLTYLYIFCT